LLGAYIADAHWGRFKTVCWAVFIALIGHIILIISAVPGVIEKKSAIAPFIISLIVMGFGRWHLLFELGVNLMINRNGDVQGKHISSCCGTVQAHQAIRGDYRKWGACHRGPISDSLESLHGKFFTCG